MTHLVALVALLAASTATELAPVATGSAGTATTAAATNVLAVAGVVARSVTLEARISGHFLVAFAEGYFLLGCVVAYSALLNPTRSPIPATTSCASQLLLLSLLLHTTLLPSPHSPDDTGSNTGQGIDQFNMESKRKSKIWDQPHTFSYFSQHSNFVSELPTKGGKIHDALRKKSKCRFFTAHDGGRPQDIANL